VCGDFGGQAPDPWMLEQLRALLCGAVPEVEWPAGRVAPGDRDANTLAAPHVDRLSGIHAGSLTGTLTGTLWGGNLAMLASLAGTRWMPRIEGGLLFVEDIAEHPYRVERMLLQLLHAGVLDRQRALLLGEFTGWRPAPHDQGFDLATVADYISQRAGLPVIAGLPFGHVPRRAVLGVGRCYRLSLSEEPSLPEVGDSARPARSASEGRWAKLGAFEAQACVDAEGREGAPTNDSATTQLRPSSMA
jgi:muramoyltetrapeptide carboxypeptidase